MSDTRVIYEEKPVPALVLQEDTSYHGSPHWETVKTLATDPARIKQYYAFHEMLDYIKQIDREPERKPAVPTAQQDSNQSKKKGKPTYER